MDLASGCQLDQYRLEEMVAKTATASLFRATDLETKRTVALKIPHLEAESDLVFYERFQREATIGRELDHSAVTKVFSKQQQSRVYLAMEWNEGQSLRVVLEKEGKLPLERAIRITTAICEALDYIHSSGVVHRDLKPENIFLGPDDNVKLIDFGIAARRGARRITFGQFSSIMGTPDYIAPERVRGKRGDNRSDLFAVGVMFWEMLTGEVPFKNDNAMAAINQRLIGDLTIGDTEVLQPQFTRIVQRALAREPKARFQSARELAWALSNPESFMEESVPKVSDRVGVCAGLAMIPTILFLLLLLAAQHQ